MSASTPNRTFRLLTVNNVPERAKKVIGQVVEELKTRYRIEHVGNCFGTFGRAASLDVKMTLEAMLTSVLDKSEVAPKVKELKPDILVCTFTATTTSFPNHC